MLQFNTEDGQTINVAEIASPPGFELLTAHRPPGRDLLFASTPVIGWRLWPSGPEPIVLDSCFERIPVHHERAIKCPDGRVVRSGVIYDDETAWRIAMRGMFRRRPTASLGPHLAG